MILNKPKITSVIIASLLLPVYSYADNVVNEVGASISNAAAKAGTAIENAADATSDAASDTAITAKVKTLLAVESDIPMDISVTTTDNIVYLSGTVDTTIQANRVIEIAQSVDGVRDVISSKLEVTSSDSFLSDAVITAKVKGKIMQLSNAKKISSQNNLHVETTNGEVHIFGSVGKSKDKDTIKAAVGDVSGVKLVKLNIDVTRK